MKVNTEIYMLLCLHAAWFHDKALLKTLASDIASKYIFLNAEIHEYSGLATSFPGNVGQDRIVALNSQISVL